MKKSRRIRKASRRTQATLGGDLRRFFGCCTDDLVVHDHDFSVMGKVIGLHVFEQARIAPEIEVVDFANYQPIDNRHRMPVHYRSEQVSFGETRQFVSDGVAFIVHHGLDDLEIVLLLDSDDESSPYVWRQRMQVFLRDSDAGAMTDVLNWLKAIEDRRHPLQGAAISLDSAGMSFLPPQNVERTDIILPAELLDDIERNFSFLDEPRAFPDALRHRALLLSGKPGVGKTMIAKWLAGRFDCTLLWVTPGSVWRHGVSTIFPFARSLAPALLVFEDLDVASGERHGAQPLGDLLSQFDGFQDLTDIAIIATTNQPEMLDEALNPESRPGRFHALLQIDPPDDDLRRVLLEKLVAESTVFAEHGAPSVDELLRTSSGATGAQLTELVRDVESRILWQQRSGKPCDLKGALGETVNSRRYNPSGACGFDAPS